MFNILVLFFVLSFANFTAIDPKPEQLIKLPSNYTYQVDDLHITKAYE